MVQLVGSSNTTRKKLKTFSLRGGFNLLWRMRKAGWDVFKNPPCRMHHTEHGIFAKLLSIVIEFADETLKKVGTLALLGTLPDLRIFPREFTPWKKVTP
jgi:hypothetical protein